ncbi:MAG: ArsR/SmtB family transcription factor [Bacillota bacterium]
MKPSDCEAVADVVKALSNPSRLRILCVLSDGGELRVSDVVAKARMRQANVSIQLGLLRSKGILASRREEVNVYYSIADHRVYEALELLLKVAEDHAVNPSTRCRSLRGDVK